MPHSVTGRRTKGAGAGAPALRGGENRSRAVGLLLRGSSDRRDCVVAFCHISRASPGHGRGLAAGSGEGRAPKSEEWRAAPGKGYALTFRIRPRHGIFYGNRCEEIAGRPGTDERRAQE